MNQTANLSGTVLVSVINSDGSVARSLPPIRNLWLDRGLDSLARILIPDAFNICAKGSGQAATKEAVHASNTYTLAGNTVTRNTSPATPRDFTADDVGKLIRASTANEVMISHYTDALHVDIVPVGQNPLVPFSARNITIYNVQLVGLTGESFSRFPTGAASKIEGSSTVTADAGTFQAGDVGKAILVTASMDDPSTQRYKIATYVSDTQVTVTSTVGVFTARNIIVYSPRVGDSGLSPLSRTDVTSQASGENSTVDTLTTGTRVLQRTFIFDAEPEVIEYRSSDDAGTYTWAATSITRTAGARDFIAGDVNKYIKFSDGEYCKITVRNSATNVTVDRSPTATITSGTISLYGNNSYDGIGFSDNGDTGDNLNILVRLESTGGAVTPVLVAGANPELPGQQLKVTYVCNVILGPTAVSARTACPINDPNHIMSSNKFGTFVVEAMALARIDTTGLTISDFSVLEPSQPGYMALSAVATALSAGMKEPDRSAGAQSTPLTAKGYTAGDFTQLYEGTFAINDANGSIWRSLGIFDIVNTAFAFTFLFEANQAKTPEVIIVIRWRKSWNRDLS